MVRLVAACGHVCLLPPPHPALADRQAGFPRPARAHSMQQGMGSVTRDPRRDDPLATARRPGQVDLDAIEALGEYVSDCRWSAASGVVRGLDAAAFPEIATTVREDDAQWIAFFDPPTVRRIVTELRELRQDQENWFAYLRWRGAQDDQEMAQ